MDELKLTGNSLKGSRPILSFDKLFEETPHYSLLRELFTQVAALCVKETHMLHEPLCAQVFSTPCYHPKSKPFIDHIFNFSIFDNRIWFRNYQIVEEDTSLVEIGRSRALCMCMHSCRGFNSISVITHTSMLYSKIYTMSRLS
jgi:ribosome biogenesis protein BRX1